MQNSINTSYSLFSFSLTHSLTHTTSWRKMLEMKLTIFFPSLICSVCLVDADQMQKWANKWKPTEASDANIKNKTIQTHINYPNQRTKNFMWKMQIKWKRKNSVIRSAYIRNAHSMFWADELFGCVCVCMRYSFKNIQVYCPYLSQKRLPLDLISNIKDCMNMQPMLTLTLSLCSFWYMVQLAEFWLKNAKLKSYRMSDRHKGFRKRESF